MDLRFDGVRLDTEKTPPEESVRWNSSRRSYNERAAALGEI